MLADAPKFFEFPNEGIKNPDFLSTVGSGWKNFENKTLACYKVLTMHFYNELLFVFIVNYFFRSN